MTDQDDRFVEEARQKHLGRLLLEAQRGFSENFLRRLRASSPQARTITLTHVNIIAQIPAEGVRITVLAVRVGMTKQAVGQFLRDMDANGLIERVPDPTDGRATSVRFSELGRQVMRDSLGIKDAIESEYRALLGDQAVETLLHALIAIIHYENDK